MSTARDNIFTGVYNTGNVLCIQDEGDDEDKEYDPVAAYAAEEEYNPELPQYSPDDTLDIVRKPRPLKHPLPASVIKKPAVTTKRASKCGGCL